MSYHTGTVTTSHPSYSERFPRPSLPAVSAATAWTLKKIVLVVCMGVVGTVCLGAATYFGIKKLISSLRTNSVPQIKQPCSSFSSQSLKASHNVNMRRRVILRKGHGQSFDIGEAQDLMEETEIDPKGGEVLQPQPRENDSKVGQQHLLKQKILKQKPPFVKKTEKSVKDEQNEKNKVIPKQNASLNLSLLPNGGDDVLTTPSFIPESASQIKILESHNAAEKIKTELISGTDTANTASDQKVPISFTVKQKNPHWVRRKFNSLTNTVIKTFKNIKAQATPIIKKWFCRKTKKRSAKKDALKQEIEMRKVTKKPASDSASKKFLSTPESDFSNTSIPLTKIQAPLSSAPSPFKRTSLPVMKSIKMHIKGCLNSLKNSAQSAISFFIKKKERKDVEMAEDGTDVQLEDIVTSDVILTEDEADENIDELCQVKELKNKGETLSSSESNKEISGFIDTGSLSSKSFTEATLLEESGYSAFETADIEEESSSENYSDITPGSSICVEIVDDCTLSYALNGSEDYDSSHKVLTEPSNCTGKAHEAACSFEWNDGIMSNYDSKEGNIDASLYKLESPIVVNGATPT